MADRLLNLEDVNTGQGRERPDTSDGASGVTEHLSIAEAHTEPMTYSQIRHGGIGRPALVPKQG